jgi:hypothetical protein
MMKSLMISCFDKSAVMAKPWAEEGYLCVTALIVQHPRGETRDGNIIKVGADMHTWIPPTGRHCLCLPSSHPARIWPCRAQDGSERRDSIRLSDAIALFARCIDIAETLECPYGSLKIP